MRRVLVVLLLLGATSPPARAEVPELGGAVFAGSESADPESEGHVGGMLTFALWSGRIAGVLEAGIEERHPRALRWVGIGARAALLEETRVCPPHRPAGDPNGCIGTRIWIDGGVLREAWDWETHFDDDRGRYERNAVYAGVGIDAMTDWLTMTTFFRVQRGRVPDKLPVMDMRDPPYETSLVAGLGFAFRSR